MKQLLTIGLCISLFACGAADHQRLLNKQMYAYNQQLRWAILDSAQGFVESNHMDQWRRAHLESRQNLKIISIEPQLTQLIRQQPPKATFNVKISFYIDGDMRVQHSVWKQQWAFNEGAWRLEKEESLTGSSDVWP